MEVGVCEIVMLAFGCWGTGSAVDTDDVRLEFHSAGFRQAPVTPITDVDPADEGEPLLFILRFLVGRDEQFMGLWYYSRMQHPVHDEALMDEALAAIRRAITNEDSNETTLASPSSREEAKAKPIPEAALLSREATAAIGSAINTLTETVKKHEPTLEEVVREALRPMLKSWLDENLPRVVERMV
jgi:hypothetical protein